MRGRILAVDYGSKRLGVAVSDETATLARPLQTVEQSEGVCEVVARLATEQQVAKVVVGRPQTLRQKQSQSTDEAEAFAERLRACLPPEIEVVRWDERLTTKQALAVMREAGIDARRARPRIDMVSAALLLQSYLDCCRRSEAAEE